MASGEVKITLPPDASSEMIDRVKEAFPEAALDTVEPTADAVSKVGDAELAIAQAVEQAPRFGESLSTWSSSLPGGGLVTILSILAIILAAYAVEIVVRSATRRWNTMPVEGDAIPFQQRLVGAGSWFAARLLSLVVFVIAARIVGRLVLPSDEGIREIGLGLLEAVLFARLYIGLNEALLAPKTPNRRLMGFDDADAAFVMRAGIIVAVVAGLIRALRSIIMSAGGEGPEVAAPLLVLVFANCGIAIWYFLRIREPIARLVARLVKDPMREDFSWRHWFAERWHWAFMLCIVLDTLLKAIGVLGLLGSGAASGAGPVILVLALTVLIVAGLAVWRREREAEGSADWTIGLFVLVEGLAIVGGAILLLFLWGIDPLHSQAESGIARMLPSIVETAVIIVAGIALARAVTALLQQRASDDGEEDGGDGMGSEGSRLETVVPIIRGFALAAVAITTGMMALSALGVSVAPLIASAGVIGLAIGFGAQKLVADVISGVFYLYEDAFRLGEYIVSASGKGTVERISIRSVTLRHHRGPIYTVPFSEMGTIQNHSRDFVVMKFSFAVPDDTDVEMVRKLVKKAGQQLAEDPELKDKLLAPLKSQGAISIQGRSFEIGCKFTARPGQQFIVRRKAYVILQQALREKGVELFAPTLTLENGTFSSSGAAKQ